MALIKCPECGREGVSEYAEACPSCGFVIRQYVQLVKEEQEKREKEEKERIEREEWERKRRIREEEERKLEEERRKREKLKRIKEYNQKFNEINYSLKLELKEIEAEKTIAKPKIENFLIKKEIILALGISIIFIPLVFVFYKMYVDTLYYYIRFIWLSFVSLICGLIALSFLISKSIKNYLSYKKILDLYNEQNQNWENYKEKKKKDAIQSAEILKSDLREKFLSDEEF